MALVHCRECGEMIADNAPTCPKCGAKQATGAASFFESFKPGSVGLKILSFLIWLAGLILFLVKMNNEAEAAKSYGLWALAGLVSCIFWWISWIVGLASLIVGIVFIVRSSK